MGRKRHKKRVSSPQCSPGVGLPSPDIYYPFPSHSYGPEAFKILKERVREEERESKLRTERIRAAGFEPYQSLKYKDQYVSLMDIYDSYAIVEFVGIQFKVSTNELR